MDQLREMLTPFRFQHSIGTMEMCGVLAQKYGYDVETAKIAGLLHDCGKDFDNREMVRQCKAYKIHMDQYFISNPVLAHGELGARIAENEFSLEGISRKEEIIAAIADHATGRPNMSTLSKILFVADYTERGRIGDHFELIRKAAQITLEKAVLEAYNHLIRSLIKDNSVIHPLTIEGRNSCIF